MAEASISVAQVQFSCPVCLDILKDPVTIPCGHSYCMNCITDCWNLEDQKGVYSCPECRQTFTPRPVLCKNLVFAEMVEKLKTKLLADVPAHCYAGPGDAECDICSGTKYKAIKSCLVLQEVICRKHDKLLDIYCRTDQQCICYLCGMDEHKNHDTVTAVEEKQEQLRKTQTEFKKRIQQKEKEVQELRETVKSHKRSALASVVDSEKIFTELIHFIETRRSEFTQLVRDGLHIIYLKHLLIFQICTHNCTYNCLYYILFFASFFFALCLSCKFVYYYFIVFYYVSCFYSIINIYCHFECVLGEKKPY
ncbi:E3 ubiquitin/ISG15 ligase TRIM25 [Anabarilius grahami]|uniref:E3 ubiquitin/ISG15 ligase TRIM25 n=1 Tax=Anabarilius grahami TaxID=495550 RepID=A0A3N0YJQ9_ANAGA|nr:E3 ubiquitin/ISG15 ligase TRIM25 [Anabarilius grahami]